MLGANWWLQNGLGLSAICKGTFSHITPDSWFIFDTECVIFTLS